MSVRALIDCKPSPAEALIKPRLDADEALASLSDADLLDVVLLEVTRRSRTGLSSDRAERYTQFANEVGRAVWPWVAA